MHAALYALFHHGAGCLIRFIYVTLEMIIIGRATAAANKFCKTVAALLTRKQTRSGEFFPYFSVENAVVNVAHQKIFVTGKLMARINIAVGNYRKILVARSARGNFFLKTNPALQIDVEVKEIEPFSVFVFIKVFLA